MNEIGLIRRNARWLLRLTALMHVTTFLVITASISESLACNEMVSGQHVGKIDSMFMMKKEFEALDDELLRDKPIWMAEDANVINRANTIAQKYIPVDCELSKVLIALVNSGFKVSDIPQFKTPAFRASIFLRKWFDILPIEFRLHIEHQEGKVKLVTVTIHHNFF